jgi:hypothetical protein
VKTEAVIIPGASRQRCHLAPAVVDPNASAIALEGALMGRLVAVREGRVYTR